MLTLWGRRSSFNVQKVLWLLGELGLPREHVEAGGAFGGLDDPAFRAMNPHGKVPVIDDDGTVVWESHAILRYLAARHGGAAWWSPDPSRRVAVDAWMDWSQTTLQPDFLMGVFWGGYRTPPAQQDTVAVARCVRRCGAHFRQVEALLAGRAFLLGETPGLADITVGTHLYRYFGMEIERPPLPGVEAWYERLRERAPFREAVMVEFRSLRGRLDY
jgi:glutathione S-transferase